MDERQNLLVHRLTFLAIAIVLVWTSSNINWSERRAERIIKVDGNGYYAYLPAIFIYHDLGFSFFEDIHKKYGSGNFGYDYRYSYKGDTVNKYFAGTAVAQAPFFLLADLTTLISGRERDGYSYFYLLFISIASLFYLLIALYFFDKYLKDEGLVLPVRTAMLVLFALGTHVFYYAVYEPSMSHVYSLAFVTIFLYSVRRYSVTLKGNLLLLAGFSLGMITLIRPVNLLVVFSLPFLLIASPHRFALIRSNTRWIWGGLIFLLIIGAQPLIYKLQTGGFFLYSYGEEGFDLTRSRFFSFLASYRKGLWVYTPVTFVSLGGFYYLWKRSPARMWALLAFLILLVYILASWHQWYYGGSFSSRVMIEYLPFFILLAGWMLNDIKHIGLRWAASVTFLVLILLNLVQTYQYYAGIIHWSDMDKEMYWDIFLRLTSPH